MFAKYIKLRDTDQYGYGRCIETGKTIFYKFVNGRTVSNCDAGHFITRGVKSIMFCETNVHAQLSINNRAGLNQKNYRSNITRKYGEEVVNWMVSKQKKSSHDPDRLDDDYLKWVIDYYGGKIECLLKDKMF